MKTATIVSIAVAAAFGLAAHAQPQSTQQSQQQKDSEFITKAAQANLAEVQLGKLGAQKSQNDQIKQFSQHLQTDHQSANQKLAPIAQSKGIQLPKDPGSQHQKQMSQLQGLSGAQFDKAFATTALKDHAQTIQLFQKEAQQGLDPATKQYAQSMLPALEHHLDMAKDVAKNVGLNEATVSSILQQYPAAVGGTGAGTFKGQGQGGSQPKQNQPK